MIKDLIADKKNPEVSSAEVDKINCLRCKNKITQRITKNSNKSLYCKECSKETNMEIIE